jgi:hypothetical protein
MPSLLKGWIAGGHRGTFLRHKIDAQVGTMARCHRLSMQ